jgi:predicted RNA-binding protein with PUA-like domain
VSFVRIFKEVLGLSDLRKEAPLKNMELMKKGSRLSVQPVTEDQYRHILSMAEKRGL